MNIALFLVIVLPVIIIITICFIRVGFKNAICKADSGNCVLYSQFSCRPHSALLPNPVGENIYNILKNESNAVRLSWDLSIFLDISFDTVLERAMKRDLSYFGSEDEVKQMLFYPINNLEYLCLNLNEY
ncbi:MAG: hypothetical protein ACQESP_10275 [Candidatus Muiribacteriota bacterium]